MLALCINGRVKNRVKSARCGNNSTREVEFGSLDGVDSGEYNGVGTVEITKMFGTRVIFCYLMIWF